MVVLLFDRQGVRRNTTGSAVSYDMGVEVQTSEVAIYVQWYEKMDLNSDERKYRVNGTLRPRPGIPRSALS